jgi:hypothetical protein
MDSLINRLEAAESGSHRLSDDMLRATGWTERRLPMDIVPYWMHDGHPGVALSVAEEAVTTSLDAALALAERVLPGWDWSVSGVKEPIWGYNDDREGPPRATLRRRGPLVANEGLSIAHASTPALALCLAILRASNPTDGEGR